jgi:putative endonuclease
MITVYVLQSESTGRFYIGVTADVDRRVAEHNARQNPSTRGRGPWRLVYTEQYPTRCEALHRERQLKSWRSHTALAELIAQR